MKIHAIQTGFVGIKTAQVEARGHGLARRMAIFTHPEWTDWRPTYARAIEHAHGVIVADTGQGAHLPEHGRSLHPYLRSEVAFRIEREAGIGPQLLALRIGPRDVKQVVLTHLHIDHDGGLAHFPHSEILVSRRELETASGIAGRLRGYLPQRWPDWFDPKPLTPDPVPFGPFHHSKRLTGDGSVIVVATPGHMADHWLVLVQVGNLWVMLAGDSSYNQHLMLAGRIDGVSPSDAVAAATLGRIRQLAQSQRAVYLPTHDPDSARRLAALESVDQVNVAVVGPEQSGVTT